jgi:lipid-binding SYLF domain-containing protein
MRSAMFKLLLAVIAAAPALMSLPAHCAPSFEELDERIATCNVVLKSMLAMPDSAIPREIITRSRAVAIFPRFLKIGALVGIGYGSGVALGRFKESAEWSNPVFFRMKGGSFGLQMGVQSTDIVLLVMTEKGFEGLLEDKVTLGVDVSLAAGPLGRDVSAETNLRLDASFLSYARSRGFFAGMSLTGATLQSDTEANSVYHGVGISAQDIFFEGKGVLSERGKTLIQTLEEACGN